MHKLMTILALLLIGSGVLLASESETPPEPTNEAIDCDPAALAETQAELSAMLAAFSADIDSVPDTALAALYDVGVQYQEIALACGHIPDDVDQLVINNTDIERILAVYETLSGDPLRGQLLYNGQELASGGSTLGCSSCHSNAEIAPLTEGTWTRFDEIRSLEPEHTDKPFAEYIIESIVLPTVYTVEPYPELAMPNFYSTQLSYQDLVDIVAYLDGQDQFLE